MAMTEDDLILLRRQIIPRQGCRLCLGPDTECVSIFGTAAADKEPLASKIQNCVSIKIHQQDRLSARICHACISYLNSWQSFKNRCTTAEKRQKFLLERYAANQRKQKASQHAAAQQAANAQRQRQIDQRNQVMQQRLLKQALSQPNQQQQPSSHSSPLSAAQRIVNSFQLNSSVEVSYIKEEPAEDVNEDGENEEIDDVDPTQFLARDDDDEQLDDQQLLNNSNGSRRTGGPSILTSLGLTHINHVNPYNFLSTELGGNDSYTSADQGDDSLYSSSLSIHPRRLSNVSNNPSGGQAACTICNMKFSNRANARRHERNIHGKKNLLIQSGPSHHVTLAELKPPATAGSSPSMKLPELQIYGVFDYDKPELLRKFMTGSKLHFIKRNFEFLQQYQTMTCNCCNQAYLTYKEFMTHMRKKCENLPRNLCFKCLTQFETKPQFIAHLKKRNCINLFRVYMADDTIDKAELPPSPPPQKITTKDIIANKVYGCKLCTKQFRLKVAFRSHIILDHADEQKTMTSGLSCGYCQTEFDDPVLRKRHYSNMDCMTFLICGTCDEKFDTLSQYIEHVYAHHLHQVGGGGNSNYGGVGGIGGGFGGGIIAGGSGFDESRTNNNNSDADGADGDSLMMMSHNTSSDMDINQISPDRRSSGSSLKYPQCCPICGKQYNNYYNVLRHMESKHPNQLPSTYRCEQCNIGYPRQMELRDHMFTKHGITLPKLKRDRDWVYCRMCGFSLDSHEAWLDHQQNSHSRYRCNYCEYETEDRPQFETHFGEHQAQRDAEKKQQELQAAAKPSYPCTICQHSFNSERGLDTHLAVVHQVRRKTPATVTSNQMKINDVIGGGGNSLIPDIVIKNELIEEDNDDQHQDQQLNMFMNGNDDDGNDGDNDETFNSNNYAAPPKKIKLERPPGIMKTLLTTNSSIRQCPLCQEIFSGGIALSNHMRTHGIYGSEHRPPKPKPNPELLAARRAAMVSAGVKHSSRIRCRICQKRIHTKASYKRHMLTVHQVRDCVFIRCTLCPAEFSNDKGLKVHMFRTHQITVQQMQQDQRFRPVAKQESTSANPLDAMNRSANGGGGGGGIGGAVAGGGSRDTKDIPKLLPKLLPKLQPKLMFECDICHTVYRNKEQLGNHKRVVHGIQDSNDTSTAMDTTAELDADELPEPTLPIPEAWWQCRYCDENFNASKKLTIHMNSHAEHDTSDLTCKDCGNVYRTRKSLHVHRHKKHPRIPNPSTCELCNKVFFDETELVCHLKTHSNEEVFFHLREKQKQLKQETTQHDDNDNNPEDDEDDGADEDEPTSLNFNNIVTGSNNDDENLSCHICGQLFHDKRVLSKHLRMHESESEALADNPLAAMLSDTQIAGIDDNDADYNYPTYQGQMVDGQYACDMCPKTFPVINALKVHRGWHFRSPTGRQVTDPSNMWQPDSVPQSKQRRSRMSNPPVCPYCKSTFASGNNLRRHIVEVHKRNEAKMARENGTVSDSVFIEKELECHTCGITFNTRPEWVDHKIQHARTMKPSTTFEWGCEICGKVFTRKERLLAHMVAHLNGKEDDTSVHSADQQSGEMGDSRSSISSQSQSQQSQESSSVLQQKLHQQLQQRQKLLFKQQQQLQQQQEQKQRERPVQHQVGDEPPLPHEYDDEDDVEDEDEEEEEMEAEEMDADDNDAKSASDKSQTAAAYSCDLCQVFFHTAKELRRHVTSHIITTAPDASGTETQGNLRPTVSSSSPKPVADSDENKREIADNRDKYNDDEDEDEDDMEVDNNDKSSATNPTINATKDQYNNDDDDEEDDDDDSVDRNSVDRNHENRNNENNAEDEDDLDDEDEEDEEEEEDDDDDEEANERKEVENNDVRQQHQPQMQQQQQQRSHHTDFIPPSIAVDGYKCRLCGKNNASPHDMIQCMENHKKPNNSRCSECLLFFTDGNRLRLHEDMCHPKSFY